MELFLGFAKIAACGFGGVLAWSRRIIVQERGWLGAEESVPPGAGAPVRLSARPRLYGPDAVGKAYGRKAMQQYRGNTS